jgi:uncharacterized YigZ family protein
MVNDTYLTLRGMISNKMKVKGSRFVGYAVPVKSSEEANNFIHDISCKHEDATHCCYAYQLHLEDNPVVFRFSDAGEPSGTAGIPILEAIRGRGLTNVVCVVVRYFGGTKLGVGGLARTYSQCAKNTLEIGKTVKVYMKDQLHISLKTIVVGL